MKNLVKQLSQRNISFNPMYRELTGSLTGGILLSQLMYWFSKKGKIFKVDKELMSETTLTTDELRTAKKLIKKLPFITVSKEGIPAKTYYEIDWEIFVIVVKRTKEKDENSLNCDRENTKSSLGDKHNIVSGNSLNCDRDIPETNKINLLTETTTETTTERKINKKSIVPADVIAFYRTNISNLQNNIKEQKSFNLLALKIDEIEKIYIGLENYRDALAMSLVDKKYVKSLKNFIEDKVYLDFQEEIKNKETHGWSNHGLDYDDRGEWH